ncbi:MAG: oxygen-independent coproporphyrinogen III oxidase [Sphingomonadales bacterium]
MDQRLSGYATRAVPRYTSYPTVPHFSPDIGPDDYATWLSSLDPLDPLSLYLHVPFCKKVCWYCGCNMKLSARYQPIADYAATLRKEIGLVAGYLPTRMRVSHMHWGGGTPTSLSESDLGHAMEVIDHHFSFASDAELAIESDPRTLSGDMIKHLAGLGFNRASFGVQEFDPQVQLAINRVQPPDMVRASVDGLRAAGIANINFDLIYGLPHQTVGTLTRTIELCAAMRPNRVALFGYAHVPWMAKAQRMIDAAALPGAAERLAQAKAASEALVAMGYVAIGLDHFAVPDDPLALAVRQGTLRRNFQGYTTDTATTLLGMGATSIGRTPHGYTQSIAETRAWTRAVEAGTLPIAKGCALTADDTLRGWVIEQLMCNGRVDLAAAAAQHKAPLGWYAEVETDLAQMERDGLIYRDAAHRITMTKAGAPLVRTVAAVFDAYLRAKAAQHSVAV